MQRSPLCPNCGHNFGTKDPARPHGPRMPLLLNCGHTFCEGCLTLLAKRQKAEISCPTCQAPTPLKLADGSVKELSADIYTLGLLAANRRSVFELSEPSFTVPAPKPVLRSLSAEQQAEQELCDECVQHPATCKCVKCESIMCTACFQKVHKASKLLQKHQPMPLYEEDSDELSLNCKEHEGRPIDYYCEDDNMAICSHCVVVGAHKNHNISAIEEKNAIAAQELEPALQKASDVHLRMSQTEKILGAALPEVKQSVVNLTSDIRKHFQMLHGALQAKELALIQQAQDLYMEGTLPIEKLRIAVADGMRELENTMKSAKKIIQNTKNTLSAQKVLEKLKEADNLPCKVEMEEAKEDQMRFKIDDDFVDSVKNLGSLEGRTQMRFTMKSLSEMTPEERAEPAEQAVTVNGTHTASKSWYELSMVEDRESDLDSETTSLATTDSVGSKKSKKKKVPTATLR